MMHLHNYFFSFTSGSRRKHSRFFNDFLYLIYKLTRSHKILLGYTREPLSHAIYTCVNIHIYKSVCIYTRAYRLCLSPQKTCICEYGTYLFVIKEKVTVNPAVFLLCSFTKLIGGLQ